MGQAIDLYVLFLARIKAKKWRRRCEWNDGDSVVCLRIYPGLYRERPITWIGYDHRRTALVAIEYYARCVDGQCCLAGRYIGCAHE